MFTIQNTECVIQVELNPDGKQYSANVPYRATLVSGKWPEDKELLVACDNRAFGMGDSTFGGTVNSLSPTVKNVVVYID